MLLLVLLLLPLQLLQVLLVLLLQLLTRPKGKTQQRKRALKMSIKNGTNNEEEPTGTRAKYVKATEAKPKEMQEKCTEKTVRREN